MSSSTDSDPGETQEVNYNEGATELFLAVEDGDWRSALQLINEDKQHQAQIWVTSTGKGDDNIGWSLWRRLPLHEACRRQAPAWFVSALLSAHPIAAEATTQFGELPLHLAVECGAPPEVINLLIVTYWKGVVVNDQSGRTPLAILRESEVFGQEDHKIVFESLWRAQKTFEEIQENHFQEMNKIKEHHTIGLSAIRQQHDEDLQQEQEEHEKLIDEVRRLKGLVDESKFREAKNMEHSLQLDKIVASQKVMLDHLDEKIKVVSSSEEEKASRVMLLEKQATQKDSRITSLEKQVCDLKHNLQEVGLWQRDVLSEKMSQTEESVHGMVENFVSLMDLLSGHGERLSSALQDRGISLPPPEEKKVEDDAKCDEADSDTDDESVRNLAAVAESALQVD